MKRMIFFSKSKLAANLLQFLFHESAIECLCIQDQKDIKTKLFSQKKLLIVFDDSFLTKTNSETIAWLANTKFDPSQKIIFLTSATNSQTPPFAVNEIIHKPFLADDFVKRIKNHFGSKE